MKDIKMKSLSYPCSTDVSSLERNLEFIPDSLVFFLRQLTSTKSPDLKVAALGQAIVQCVLPRSTIAPLQLGLAIQMHHQFSSKFLVDTLNSLGFCSSYSEVQKYEENAAAFLGKDDIKIPENCNIQFVADNVDHDIKTLDGKGTFHGMGIIMSLTPAQKVTCRVPRLSVNMTEIAELNKISVDFCRRPDKESVSLTFANIGLGKETPFDFFTDPCKYHLLPKLTWPIKSKAMEWNSFMQAFQHGKYPGQSSIMFLPMIDLNPSDPSCIYSTLKFVHSEARKWDRQPVITFDQPLYWKGLTIISTAKENADLNDIVLRLGPFHMQMSFLGCIGYIMQSSGLKEVFETVYASCSVDQMLSGKAVSRAMRAHFLLDSALTFLLFCKLHGIDPLEQLEEGEGPPSNLLEQEVLASMGKMYDKLSEKDEREGEIDLDWDLINDLQIKMNEFGKEAERKGNRTALLWLQYMKMVNILRNFIMAERTGDWNIHLSMVRSMLPFYAAAGHNMYTRSAYVYFQQMSDLADTCPDVYKAFMEGHHVIRRSDRFWAGLSTDLTIEQVLMRSIKSNGGMTRGKGMSENQRTQWLLSMPYCSVMNLAMQDLTKTRYESSEQHKESGAERIKRDFQDKCKLLGFIKVRNPFDEGTDLRNIETGVTCDRSVTVDRAEEIGNTLLGSMTGKNIATFSFKKSQRTVPMNAKCSITIDDEKVFVDPQLLFQRLLAASNRIVEDKADIFQFELASIPPSLFDQHGLMRSPQKSQLADAIWKILERSNIEDEITDPHYVVDGGSLLHRIPWQNDSTFALICSSYVDFLQRNFVPCTVVFDGYQSAHSTKDSTHIRRSKGAVGTAVHFDEKTPFRGKKEMFLNNTKNKDNFLKLLGQTLERHGIDVKYADGDADLMIVLTAKEISELKPVIVIAEDTDILVLLIHYANNTGYPIYMQSSGSNSSQKKWNVDETAKSIGEDMCRVLPVMHVITGCDTTSRPFGVGKGKAFKEFRSKPELRQLACVFLERSSKEDIVKSGEEIICQLFKGMPCEGLNFLRFRLFGKKTILGTKVLHIQSLPPTSDAASFHSMRVYHQVQMWIGNEINPCDWGWTVKGSLLLPVRNSLGPGPRELLKVVRCSCKGGCDTVRCSCRKHGLNCTQLCGDCRGHGCTNSEVPEID